MTWRVVLPALATAALLAAISGASRVPWTWSDDERAVLRLSWRAPAVRIEECRPLTAEEKAELPVHMRRDSTCVGRGVDFRLTAEVDGRTVVTDTLAGPEDLGDRRVAVEREVPIEPGQRRVSVSFEPIGDAGREAGRPLRLERTLDLDPREAAVVTLEDGALVVKTAE